MKQEIAASRVTVVKRNADQLSGAENSYEQVFNSLWPLITDQLYFCSRMYQIFSLFQALKQYRRETDGTGAGLAVKEPEVLCGDKLAPRNVIAGG